MDILRTKLPDHGWDQVFEWLDDLGLSIWDALNRPEIRQQLEELIAKIKEEEQL